MNTFTVDGQGSISCLRGCNEPSKITISSVKRYLINYIAGVPDDGISRCATIHKKQVLVLKTSIGEPLGFVHSLVQSDYSGYIVPSEVREIELGSMKRIAYE